jgi:5-carboxymethyl-2-hydroxymuconate isomerase
MTPVNCAVAQRRLQELHDGELPVGEQIAVQIHVDSCRVCADSLEDIQFVGAALKSGARGRDLLSHEDSPAFVAAVVSRRSAEDGASLWFRVREMFDDMHLVYAGLGSAAATAVSVVIMLGMMRFAPVGHRNASPSASLAALMTLAAAPETSANAIAIDPASHARGTARFQAANETAAEDAVFELASVVTRKGRLVNLARLKKGHKATRDEAKAIEELLVSVTRSSIEPGWSEGAPVAAEGMVWLVTRMTVRANKAVDVDLPIPPAKAKRIALTYEPSTPVRL